MLMIKGMFDEDTDIDELNRERTKKILKIVEWCSNNKLNLINALSDEDWEYLRVLENYLVLANKEELRCTYKVVECTNLYDGSLRGINIPNDTINRLDALYDRLGPINEDKNEIDIPRNKVSLLTQEEIDAVVVLVKSGKINFDNIHRILTQEEIDSIRDILNEVKSKQKALCR